MLAGAEPWLAAVTIDVLMLTRLGFSRPMAWKCALRNGANDGKAISRAGNRTATA
jgi:hypothetical protein